MTSSGKKVWFRITNAQKNYVEKLSMALCKTAAVTPLLHWSCIKPSMYNFIVNNAPIDDEIGSRTYIRSRHLIGELYHIKFVLFYQEPPKKLEVCYFTRTVPKYSEFMLFVSEISQI